MNINHPQIKTLAGLWLAVVIACLPGNKSKIFASGITLVALGHGLGVASQSQKFKDTQSELQAQHVRALAEVERQLTVSRGEIVSLQSQLKKAIADSESKNADAKEWQLRIEVLNAALTQAQAEYQSGVVEARKLIQQELEAQYQETSDAYYQECLGKIKSRNAEHRRREQFWIAQLTEKDALLAQKDSFYEGKLQEAIAKFDELIEQYEQVLNSYHPELKQIQGLFRQQLQGVVEERDRIYAQLASYHAAKRFTGSTKADHTGNRLISFYLEQGLTVDGERCESHFEFDEIWVRPRTNTIEDLQKYSSAIYQQFELLTAPEFSIESGCIKILLRTHSKEKLANTRTIDERPENWLEDVARVSNHYRISAPTDAGKSVFLDNLVGCLQKIHGNEFRLNLADPKYPFTDWKSHTPDYRGFEQCFQAFRDLDNLIESRLAEATADVEAGRPIRSYPAEMFGFDELEILTDEARALDDGAARGKTSMELARLLRKGLKMGRGLTTQKGKGIIVAYVTQSPLCSRINLNKDDFDQSTNIFIGENIVRALNEELKDKISAKQAAYLQKQYELRKERGDVYFALVKTSKEAFIATLPTEGYYSSLKLPRLADLYPHLLEAEEASQIDPQPLMDEECSDSVPQATQPPKPEKMPKVGSVAPNPPCFYCQSIKVKKNGKKRDKQNYKCGDCGKSLTQSIDD
jgi:soluble cytochrome b562